MAGGLRGIGVALCGGVLGASLLALACMNRPGDYVVSPGSARVRVGQIDEAALETAIQSPPPSLQERAEYLVDLLWQAGCLAVEMPRPDETRTPDVICSLPGRSKERIVVVGHLDRDVGEDGVPRHWRGIALLPFLYRALGVEEREHSFEFAAFGKRPRHRAPADSAQIGAHFAEGVRAIVEIQDLDPGLIGFSATDPGLSRDFVATSLAVGRPLDSLRNFTHRRLNHRRVRIPMIVILAPRRGGEEERTSAVSSGRPDKGEGYLSAARFVAAYLGYLDETLQLRRRTAAHEIEAR